MTTNSPVWPFFLTSVFVTKPTGLKTSNVTFKSFRVDWDPVPEPFILGYSIRVENSSFAVPWDTTHAHLSGLHSNTTYIISVSPFHGLTDGDNSVENVENISITTKPELGKQH